MARSIDTIYQQLLASKSADTTLSGLTSTSQVSFWNLWLHIQAVCVNLLEQTQDIFISTEIEPTVSAIPPSTPSYIQDQVFKFQYDATTPEIATLVNFVPTYAVVNEAKRIITQCSVITDPNKNVQVKVAKESPPVKLSAAELIDLNGFLSEIQPSGVTTTAISLDPDRFFIEAEIFYDGQYAPVISANVIAAIDAFLSAIPFNGVVKISSLEEAILDVAGVNDIILNNVAARANATAFGDKQYLVQGNDLISRSWMTVAGYIIQEDTAGETFADKLVFTVG